MSQPVARLHSLRSVQLRVPTVAESTDFYSEVWGLSVVERERDETWLRGTGANHHVLQLSHGDRNGLGRISFAVRTRREVDEAARRLAAHGVPVLVEPRNLDPIRVPRALDLAEERCDGRRAGVGGFERLRDAT